MKTALLFALLVAATPLPAKETVLTGTVKTSENKPAAGAQIAVISEGEVLDFTPDTFTVKKVDDKTPVAGKIHKTDSEGKFSAPLVDPKTDVLLFRQDMETICIPASKFQKEIALQKPARVRATYLEHGKPAAGKEIGLSVYIESGPGDWVVGYNKKVTTDAAGKFESAVPPGFNITFSVQGKMEHDSHTRIAHFSCKPGENIELTLGGNGATVTGKLSAKNNPDFTKAYLQGSRTGNTFSFNNKATKDGTFTLENILPGKYSLFASISDNTMQHIADISHTFTVPEDHKGNIDLGTLEMKTHQTVAIGQDAPEFSFVDLDNKQHKLSDYRGKWVLLDFWATWCGPCVGAMPQVKKAHHALDKEQVTFITLSLDNNIEAPRKFMKTHDHPGIHGFIGQKSGVEESYNILFIPAIILISPEGKIAEINIAPSDIKETIQKKIDAGKK